MKVSNDHGNRIHCTGTFISGEERIVPAVNIYNVGEEGARSATVLVDGCEVPIYNGPEWDFLWYEQENHEVTALPEWAKE